MAGLLSPWPVEPFKFGFLKASSASSAPSGQQSARSAPADDSPMARFGHYYSVNRDVLYPLQLGTQGNSPRNIVNPKQVASERNQVSVQQAAQLDNARKANEAAQLDNARKANEANEAAIRDKLRGPVEIKQLSWEEYDALSPKQRAAVDFNGALYNATNADKQAQLKGADDPNVRGSYDKALEKTFGSRDRGSDTYAPNTLALLSTLGLNDKGGDLDEWLNMGGAVTAGDLESAGVGSDILTLEAQDALPLGQRTTLQLSNRTNNRLNDVLAKGQNLLSASAQQATAWGAVNADQLSSASSAFTSNDQKAQDFSDLFDSAVSQDVGYTTDANGNATLNTNARNLVASSLEEYNYDPNEFRDYMIARLRNYQQQDASTPGISISSDLTSSSLSLPEIRRIYFPEE